LFELRQRVQHHRDIQEAILSAIQLPTVFVVLEQHGLTYACGYGVLDGDYCGLFGLATAEIYRNRGYGTRIVQALLHWAQASKAKFAYLQVNQTNAAAVHTYKKAGFETAYTYWYRYHSEFSAGNWLFSKKDQE
jgi:ribosomal protein S18 acetylase RimI-like enzyme